MVSIGFKLVYPMLEDTIRKQTSNCDLVDFPTKILLLTKTYTMVQVLLATVTSRKLIEDRESKLN